MKQDCSITRTTEETSNIRSAKECQAERWSTKFQTAKDQEKKRKKKKRKKATTKKNTTLYDTEKMSQ